jgi:hypothetical protein
MKRRSLRVPQEGQAKYGLCPAPAPPMVVRTIVPPMERTGGASPKASRTASMEKHAKRLFGIDVKLFPRR